MSSCKRYCKFHKRWLPGTSLRGLVVQACSLTFFVFILVAFFNHQYSPNPLPLIREAVLIGLPFSAVDKGQPLQDPWAFRVEDLKNGELSDYSHGGDVTYPPSWRRLDAWEDNLPQHNLSLPSPEGKFGRYVYFQNQNRFYGWNNVLNEMLMNTHLAHESKRAYVFTDYWWFPRHNLWHADRSKWPNPTAEEWHPRTPLNALISGPTTGLAWDEGDTAPRSIHERHWEKVCPLGETRIIYTGDVKPAIAWSEGIDIFNHWKKLLTEAPERCIKIQASGDDPFPQVFDLMLWGSQRILSLWDSFSKSATSRLLTASPIVLSAVARNEYIFNPDGPRPTGKAPRDPYARMMAMHIRRGDYIDHCMNLAAWNSSFYSWNIYPTLPDIFYGPPPPPGGQEYGTNSDDNKAAFMRHCLPSKEDIVAKARGSREAYVRNGNNRLLDVMYLLTNDRTEWLEDLKARLRADGWHTIRTSRDLELDQVQLDVSNAVDMEIGRRAAVFVGNGWSSFTSNINHRRLAEGREPTSIRFW